MPRRLLAAGCFLALLLAGRGSLAKAKRERLRDFPCAGCVTELPAGEGPVGLVVALHGDEGGPGTVALPSFSGPTERAGLALLALKCPKDQGCVDGSWWRWRGEVSWLLSQIDRLAERRAVDRQRLYVVGWSGGASYLGLVSPSLEGVAGLGLFGGGLPPSDESACARCRPPVFFLVGSGNPLHHLAVAARNHFTACEHEVKWELLTGKDHAGELMALNQGGAARGIAWLEEHRKGCAPAAAPASSLAPTPAPTPTTSGSGPSPQHGRGLSRPDEDAPSGAATVSPTATATSTVVEGREMPPAHPAAARCGCRGAGEGAGGSGGFVGLILALGARRRQRRAW